MLQKINFLGVTPRYTNSQGQLIIPISKNPNQEEIDLAIKSTSTSQKPMTGYNGEAFWLGEDLVVKRFKGEKAYSNNPDREINMLDMMFDSNLFLKNSQIGQYAIKSENGTFLISTKVQGENPKYPQNPFNKENLTSLVEIITQMDIGFLLKNSSSHGFNDRCRFMNYDFNGGNINITQNSAGLFDFEYSVIENLDDMIQRTIINEKSRQNCHRSETSPIPSSLRSFELYCFCDYLKSADDASSLFEDYLEIKGKYHAKMADFYSAFTNESSFKDKVSQIASKELAHSKLLQKDENDQIPLDIKTSEAIKIQMSNFMHEQSQFCSTGKINSMQLKEFTTCAIRYFKEQLRIAQDKKDSDRIMYYGDCLDLFDDWKNVNLTLVQKIQNKDEDITPKLTKKHITTLLEKMELPIKY